tara:strand:- start:245 stop:841 length:597 start_codon:yes stop_codon:yes gene_type:complete
MAFTRKSFPTISGTSGHSSALKQIKEDEKNKKTTIEKQISTGPGSYWDKSVKGDKKTEITPISGWPKDEDIVAKSNITMDDLDEHTTSTVKKDKEGKKFVVQNPDPDGDFFSVGNTPKNTKTKTTISNVTKGGTKMGIDDYSDTEYNINDVFFSNPSNIDSSLAAVSDTLVLPSHLQDKYKEGDVLSQDDIYGIDDKK